jgi:cell shape-determining protein MreD
MTKTKKNFLVFGLCPGIWFLLAMFPCLCWFTKLSFILFWLSEIYISISLPKPYFWLGFWGGLLDIYKSNTLGPYFTGFICMGWLIRKTMQKFVWQTLPTKVILTFIVIIFLHGWYYGWIVIFDLNENIYKIKEIFIFALTGACLAPLIFKVYDILTQDAH